MNGSHQLSAARMNAVAYQESIELDPFIAQRITLINADHSRREPLYLLGGGKSWPSQRVVSLKRLNPIAHGPSIIVKVHQDTVILG